MPELPIEPDVESKMAKKQCQPSLQLKIIVTYNPLYLNHVKYSDRNSHPGIKCPLFLL